MKNYFLFNSAADGKFLCRSNRKWTPNTEGDGSVVDEQGVLKEVPKIKKKQKIKQETKAKVGRAIGEARPDKSKMYDYKPFEHKDVKDVKDGLSSGIKDTRGREAFNKIEDLKVDMASRILKGLKLVDIKKYKEVFQNYLQTEFNFDDKKINELWSKERNNLPSRDRAVLFDRSVYDENENSNDKWDNPKNIACFYEIVKGRKSHFSYNDLMNDALTWGPKLGWPIIDKNAIPEELKGKFQSPQRTVNYNIMQNIFNKLTSRQEVLAFKYVKDFDILDKYKDKRTGVIGEKVVEWFYRAMANISENYEVTVKNTTDGGDQRNKIDLIVQIEDVSAGINVKKNIQVTLDQNENVLQHKQRQLKEMKQRSGTDIDLEEFAFDNLQHSKKKWEWAGKPIGSLDDYLSNNDLDIMQDSYVRIERALITEKKKKEAGLEYRRNIQL